MKKDILSMYPEEIESDIVALGYPKYRAEQIIGWLGKGVRSFSEMKNIPAQMRSELENIYSLYKPKVLRKEVSDIDGTCKYLWELYDGNAVETVVMKYSYGNTVCVSTQVGCRQGCAFCASTIGGLVRCLNASEILDEVFYSELDSGMKISNIVLMGIGEPLDNFDNVIRFIKLVSHPKGMNIGLRHITLSTCGIIEKFDALADEMLPITLTVSLHAPDDETRSMLMPANRGRGVDQLMQACKKYFQATGRRISFEYAMVDGVNDSDRHALLLAQRANEVYAHVNLITLNHVEERRFQPSSESRMKAFVKILQDSGVNVTIRRKLGGDVNASCGQLRRKFISSETEN